VASINEISCLNEVPESGPQTVRRHSGRLPEL
jgi:hypothetical protein